MKPRTKIQVRIYALSQTIPAMTSKQKTWALKECLPHYGYRTKTHGIACMDCGHVWKDKPAITSCKCPKCKTILEVIDTRKKNVSRFATFSILDMREEFQVVRHFDIRSHHKAGEPANQSVSEVIQQFISPQHKLHVVARQRNFNYNSDSWSGDLEIRDATKGNYYISGESKYDMWPDKIYPTMVCRNEYVRNGFNADVCGISPLKLFKVLLHDSKLETLLKAKQYNLVWMRMGDNYNRVEKYWNSLKICMRHSYFPEDVKSYLDYLDLLAFFKKDMHSAKYVCPVDFKTAHNRFVAKKRIVDRKRMLEEERRKIEKDKKQLAIDTANYLVVKAPYFGLEFTEGDITIRVLESVGEFMKEADAHQHCLVTNKYYTVEKSLCFSATVGGKRMETIEVSLTDFKIQQSRGAHNNYSKHHERIVAAMNKNMRHVKKRAREASKPQQQDIAA